MRSYHSQAQEPSKAILCKVNERAVSSLPCLHHCLPPDILSPATRTPPSTSCPQFSSAQSCLTLCNPMNRSMPGLPVHHKLPEFTQTSIESVMPSSRLILCRPLLLLPPIPPSIRVFSKESTLRMRWPKYWSFSLSISPSNEHQGLIFFRMN